MEHRHLLPEVGGEDPQQLGGEDDLRHQHQGGPPSGQGLLDQPDVYLGLAAPRHPIEEGGGGPALPGQGVQPLKGRLLLPVEDRRRSGRHLLQRDAAQDLLLLQDQDPALLQRLEGGHRSPGEIAQLFGRGGPQGTQQLGHRIPQRRGLPPGGHYGHSVLRREGQHRQLLLFVPHRPLGGGLQRHDPPVCQAADGRIGVLGAKGQTDLLHLSFAAPAPQQVQQLHGSGGALGGLIGPLPVHPLPHRHLVPEGEIQPCGQHRLDAVIDGAEITLPHPQGQLDPIPVQHRIVIQHRPDGFQRLPCGGGLIDGQDQPVRPPVPGGEGHQYPHPGLQPPLQLLGDQIVIGLVDRVDRPGDSHLRYFPQGPSPPSLPRGKRPRQVAALQRSCVGTRLVVSILLPMGGGAPLTPPPAPALRL